MLIKASLKYLKKCNCIEEENEKKAEEKNLLNDEVGKR